MCGTGLDARRYSERLFDVARNRADIYLDFSGPLHGEPDSKDVRFLYLIE
jgi:hypothetical protein